MKDVLNEKKEKMKNLWTTHQDEIIGLTAVGIGLVVTAVTSTLLGRAAGIREANNKSQITGADVYMNLSGSKDRSIIIVDHKDKSQTKLESDGNSILDLLERRWLQLEASRATVTEE